MSKEIEYLRQLQEVIKSAANTVYHLMEIKKEREAKTTELKRENDWEIECIVHGNKNYWRRKDGLYVSDLFVGGSGKDWLLNNGGTIFQVTRKSDGVVFSVGDEVDSTWGKQIITGFEIRPDGDMVACFETCRNPLEKISKLPERTKLFVSHDNKDIFEGDKNWLLDLTNWCIMEDIAKEITNKYFFESYKSFSTYEAAKEYVTLNKRCLSVNDVLSADLNLNNRDKVLVWKDKLLELAKSNQ